MMGGDEDSETKKAQAIYILLGLCYNGMSKAEEEFFDG